MEVPTVSALCLRTIPHMFPPESHNSNPHSWSGPQQQPPARPLKPHKQHIPSGQGLELITVICGDDTSRHSSQSSSGGGGSDEEPLPAAANQPPAAAAAPEGRLWQLLFTGWTAAANLIAPPPLSTACAVPAPKQQ